MTENEHAADVAQVIQVDAVSGGGVGTELIPRDFLFFLYLVILCVLFIGVLFCLQSGHDGNRRALRFDS